MNTTGWEAIPRSRLSVTFPKSVPRLSSVRSILYAKVRKVVNRAIVIFAIFLDAPF